MNTFSKHRTNKPFKIFAFGALMSWFTIINAQVLNGNFELSNPLAPSTVIGGLGSEFVRITDTNSISNWTYVSGLIEVHHKDHFNMGINQAGNQHVDLNGNGLIRQTIKVEACKLNTITFNTRIHQNHNGGSATANLKIIDKYNNLVDSNWKLNFDSAGKQWRSLSFNFTPKTNSVTIEFSGIISNYDIAKTGAPSTIAHGGILIDDVVVTNANDSSHAGLNKSKLNNAINLGIYITANPTKGVFTLKQKTNGILHFNKVNMYNTEGKLIESFTNVSASKIYNLENYSNGVYYLMVEANGVLNTLKLIKNAE